jgi:hypothetical protein
MAVQGFAEDSEAFFPFFSFSESGIDIERQFDSP